jgi:hypothetical protein
LWTIHLLFKFDFIAFDEELSDSLRDSLGHHDSANEVTIRVKTDALGRSSSEMGVGCDGLMSDLNMAFNTLLKRSLEVGAQAISNHALLNLLWYINHDVSFSANAAVQAGWLARQLMRGSIGYCPLFPRINKEIPADVPWVVNEIIHFAMPSCFYPIVLAPLPPEHICPNILFK